MLTLLYKSFYEDTRRIFIQMLSKVTVAIDLMGSDRNPEPEISAIETVLSQDEDIRIASVGPKSLITHLLTNPRFVFIESSAGVPMDTPPAFALRNYSNSTLDVGTKALKEGMVDAFVTAGNTGAALAFSLKNLKRIKGIPRPGIAVVLPTEKKPKVLIDAGANADCRPEHLVGFAKLGLLYAENVLELRNPRFSLLNIGEEENKGDSLRKETYKLMMSLKDKFAGNIEPEDLLNPENEVEVIVTDGFTGNVTLKLLEGAADNIMRIVRRALSREDVLIKLGAYLVKGSLSKEFDVLRYEKYGGACLLGLEKPVVISHGRSSAEALVNAILTAKKVVEADIASMLDPLRKRGVFGGKDTSEKGTLF